MSMPQAPGGSAPQSVMGLTTLQNIASAIQSLVQVTKQSGATTAGVRAQRLVTASPITIAPGDSIINVNITTGSPACTLPSSGSRAGAQLAFKDVSGNFSAHPLTITAAGGDTIDGLASITLSTNRQFINLVPANDGTTVGWSIE